MSNGQGLKVLGQVHMVNVKVNVIKIMAKVKADVKIVKVIEDQGKGRQGRGQGYGKLFSRPIWNM